MRRILGVVLILHGLAHTGAGMWSAGAPPIEAHTVWWIAATGGFILAGCALLGVHVARAHWQPALLLALAGSVALLVQRTHPIAIVGLAIDVLLLGAWLRWRVSLSRAVGDLRTQHPARARTAQLITLVLLAHVAGTVALRPWYMRWGTTPAERAMALPADDLVPDARYQIDHAVTVRAPPEAVWPWLAQLGQPCGVL